MEAENVRTHIDEKGLILRHFKEMRTNRYFQFSQVCFIPENNLGLEGSHLHHFVQELDNVYTFIEKDRPGVRKTAKQTRDFPLIVQDYLLKGLIRFDTNLFTTSRNKSPEQLKNDLRSQLERVRVEVIEPNTPFKKRRIAISGKVGKHQDDLYIVLAMCIYWGPIAETRKLMNH